MAIFVTSGNDHLAKERLAQLLKELRGQSTQREFAKLLGTSYTALQDWEKEIRLPRENNLRRIAQLKGWTQDELLDHLFSALPQPNDALTDPLEAIYTQVHTLTAQQKQRLRDCLNVQLGYIQTAGEADMGRFLDDKQKHNLHLLLRASLKHQNPTEAMAQSGIEPDLFTDIYLRNDKNRSVDYAALEKFSALCCRVVEWRGNQPPAIERDLTYSGNVALLCHDLSGNSSVIND
jgi:transcriptional regulator with XRE-family HTH domain